MSFPKTEQRLTSLGIELGAQDFDHQPDAALTKGATPSPSLSWNEF